MSATTELQTWLNGTVNGGPNGDGRYPMTAKDGQVFLVYCPAAQALNPSLSDLPVELYAEAAEDSASNAAASASAADTARIAAQTAASDALTYRNAASTSASNAAGSASTASTGASNASGSAAAASSSASTASSASTSAVAARDLAQKWATEDDDVVVAGGHYSAKHWAGKAATSAGNINPANYAPTTRTINTTAPLTGGGDLSGNRTLAISAATTSAAGSMSAADKTKLNGIATGATANTGTVTSASLSLPAGLLVAGSPITASGTFAVTWAGGYQGYTTAEASKLGGIAAGATVGATWGTNLASIPANITSWAGIAPSAKQDALGFTPVNSEVSGSNANAVGGRSFGVLADPSTNTPTGSWTQILTNHSSQWGYQLAQPWFEDNLYLRTNGNTTWSTWKKLWHSGNFDPDTKQNALGFTPANKAGDTFSGPVLTPLLHATNNSAECVRVGDDASLHDVNVAHVLGVKSQSNAAYGGIKFGDGPVLQRDSTTALSVSGNLALSGTSDEFVQLSPTGGRAVRFAATATPNTGLYDVTNATWLLKIEANNSATFVGRVRTNAAHFNSTSAAAVLSAEAGSIYLRPHGADIDSHGVRIQNNGQIYRRWANDGGESRVPRVFVGGSDPGAAAADDDLWVW